ncbi:hypothetical protein KR074_009169, partial [Drosophila pseudoananassae]
ILTANNGNTPTHTQKDIQPCETGCQRIPNRGHGQWERKDSHIDRRTGR